ncbi:MAG: hypothetical protein LBE12_05550, partial [Planctomycetaceae bacterium]|nr:hypothetical protein [Planctomycetaceae bacterium]
QTFSQQTDKSLLSQFNELSKNVETIANTDKRASLAASWFKSHSWDKLTWREHIELLSSLQASDWLDKKNMSVRWTGKITAPASGQYIFEQLRTYTNGTMKLWIDGNLVMDTEIAVTNERDGISNTNAEEISFKSVPVVLEAGTPTNFLLEYSHDMKNVVLRQNYPMGYPVAVLMWESEAIEQQIVPKEVFSQPLEKQRGLSAEYFGDSTLTRKVANRIDDAVNFIWDQGVIINSYSSFQKDIVKKVLPYLSSDNFFRTLKKEDVAYFAEQGLSTLLSSMTASERIVLIDAISAQQQILDKIPYKNIAEQIYFVYMLPGKRHLNFLLKWSELNEQPQITPGSYVAGKGTYVDYNITPYRRVGRLWSKSDVAEIDDLIQNHLELENGTCNLTLAYILIWACKENNLTSHILERINEAIKDKDISGDQQMTWCLAKAYAEEVAVPPIIKPGRALSELQNAMLVAESEDYRYWALKETVARLITVNQNEKAQSLITNAKKQFNDVKQVEELELLLVHADEIEKTHEKSREYRQQRSREDYLKTLHQHQTDAKQKNDVKRLEQVQKTIKKYESSFKIQDISK